MDKLIREAADRALYRAISADEQANAHYYRILRQFVSAASVFPGEKQRQPDVRLDATGLKEIETAWLKHSATGKKLRSAYMKLYAANI